MLPAGFLLLLAWHCLLLTVCLFFISWADWSFSPGSTILQGFCSFWRSAAWSRWAICWGIVALWGVISSSCPYRVTYISQHYITYCWNLYFPAFYSRCVQMLEWFEHHGHVCIVFELLGLSTYDFIKENGFLPFRLDHIRQMAYQICKSVNCKYMHVCWFYLELV